MAVGVLTDLVVYQDELQAGMFESIVQNIDAFNAASLNSIRLVRQDLRGEYNKESFFQPITGLVSRRDLTSVAAETDLPMTQDEIIGVKISRKIGPATHAIGALQHVSSDQREMSYVLGQMIGKEKAKDILNTSIKGVEAAIEGQTALVYDATGESTTTLTHLHLINGLKKFGDQAQRIVCWVMHSKPYYDLMAQSVSDKITNVADLVIHGAEIGSLNRPIVVTDSPALMDDDSAGGNYSVLGLVADGVVATESEDETFIAEVVSGLAQLSFRIQGEYAFNLNCKGFKWDTSGGGANPTDASIATTSNWDKAATEDKDLAGIRILVS